MKWWQIELSILIVAFWLAYVIYGWVCHIMGGLRELAARIDALNEKVDAIQKRLRG
ncbi:MAG: hypothetical protein ACYCO5_05285 [Acidobacteriaceae bacterium]